MGCCPSKSPAAAKEYAASPAEVTAMLPSTAVSPNQVELIDNNAAEDMLMDRGDGTPMDKSDDEEEPAGEDEEKDDEDETLTKSHDLSKALDEELVRPPSPPPRKVSLTADDVPISSTYHRVHSAEVAEQEAKRQEEMRLEAEQREREVKEYKAAMQIA